jgi:putative transposase
LRYVELNPVRATMAEKAAHWEWSSASAHTGATDAGPWLDLQSWQKRWTPAEWLEYLDAGESPSEAMALRQFTHTGRPLGSPEFLAQLEQSTLRLLTPSKRGRPPKNPTSPNQSPLIFAA